MLARAGRRVFVLDRRLPGRLAECGHRGDDATAELAGLVLAYDDDWIKIGTSFSTMPLRAADTEAQLLRGTMTSRLALAAAESQDDEASWGRAAMNARIEARTAEALAGWTPTTIRVDGKVVAAHRSSTNGHTLTYATIGDGTCLFVHTQGGHPAAEIVTSARPAFIRDEPPPRPAD